MIKIASPAGIENQHRQQYSGNSGMNRDNTDE